MSILGLGQTAAVLIGLGFLALGFYAIALPHKASAGYGVSVTETDRVARAYAAAAGWRDFAAGAAVLAVLATGSGRSLAATLAAMSLIPLGDTVVLARHGIRRVRSYGPHVVGFVVVLAVAGFVLLGGL